MSTVVVVQSDDLAAWIGVAGVVVGVVLGSGIETIRSRMQRRNERRKLLADGGAMVALAGRSYLRTIEAAGDDTDKQPWIEMIGAREEAVDSAYYKIVANIADRALPTGPKRGMRAIALVDAITELREVCARWAEPGETEEELAAKRRAALDNWYCLVERANIVADVAHAPPRRANRASPT